MEKDTQNRELGRISVINALKAIAEQSTSHADAVQMAREQLIKAGVFLQHNPNLGTATREAMPFPYRFDPPLR
jgi:hypothetical protein